MDWHIDERGEYINKMLLRGNATVTHWQPLPDAPEEGEGESGSGCDTLKNIVDYCEDECPDSQQVDDLMTLCLHLLQRCKAMYEEDELEYD